MSNGTCKIIKFQLTAARRRLGYPRGFQCHHDCFNSQPPEGGWQNHFCRLESDGCCFNSQPPEGGWNFLVEDKHHLAAFQLTAARRRLVANGVTY